MEVAVALTCSEESRGRTTTGSCPHQNATLRGNACLKEGIYKHRFAYGVDCDQPIEYLFVVEVDAHQPIEYLSEMRQVTIVFINLVTAEGTKYENCQTLQAAFRIIYSNLKQAHGNDLS